MAKKNRQPTHEQIQGVIDGLEKQEVEAAAELEDASNALAAAKLADIERQRAESKAKRGMNDDIPRAQMFILEDFDGKDHLEYMRKRAVGNLGDIVRRIKLLKRALMVTPE